MPIASPRLTRAALREYTGAATGDNIERVVLEDALQDEAAYAAIRAIANESYQNAAVLLAQEFEKCNIAYRSGDAAGELAAFFLVGWLELDLARGRY